MKSNQTFSNVYKSPEWNDLSLDQTLAINLSNLNLCYVRIANTFVLLSN